MIRSILAHALWLLLMPAIALGSDVHLYRGHLYGPGILTDQKLVSGTLKGLKLHDFLDGSISHVNNGGAAPNVPGERLQGKAIDGRLSDGTQINEQIDVGYVELMNGRFGLLLAAVAGGPNQGTIHFELDEKLNWTIRDDIAIDPGFAAGVIKMQNFIFSTGPRLLPASTQTEMGHPGGMDKAGSKSTGQVIPGYLGDADFDGYLDGQFNAIGSFPLSSIFMPGAPFAQTRDFQTVIQVSARQAALLTLANAAQYIELALSTELAADLSDINLLAIVTERLNAAERHCYRFELRASRDSEVALAKRLGARILALHDALLADASAAAYAKASLQLEPIIDALREGL